MTIFEAVEYVSERLTEGARQYDVSSRKAAYTYTVIAGDDVLEVTATMRSRRVDEEGKGMVTAVFEITPEMLATT